MNCCTENLHAWSLPKLNFEKIKNSIAESLRVRHLKKSIFILTKPLDELLNQALDHRDTVHVAEEVNNLRDASNLFGKKRWILVIIFHLKMII